MKAASALRVDKALLVLSTSSAENRGQCQSLSAMAFLLRHFALSLVGLREERRWF
jgi:hypothetical protein